MTRSIQRKTASPEDNVVEARITLDFSSEEKRGRLHAQPSDMMKRIWDLAHKPDKGDELSVGVSDDQMVPAGGNLAYTIMMSVGGMVGGVRNISQLALEGKGPGGVLAVEAIGLAYDDNFGVQSGRSARDYLRMARKGTQVEPSLSAGATEPTRKVKDRREQYAGQCREVVFSRFPGTRTGTVFLGKPFMLSEVRAEVVTEKVDASTAHTELKRLQDAQQSLYNEFNRNCMAIVVNMVSNQAQTLGTPETLPSMERLFPYLVPLTKDSKRVVDRLQGNAGLSTSDLEELTADLFEDLVHGEIDIKPEVSAVGFSHMVAQVVRGRHAQVRAIQELRGERNIQFGILEAAEGIIESASAEADLIPNAELAVETAAVSAFADSGSKLVEPAKRRIQGELTGKVMVDIQDVPAESIIVCSKVPPVTVLPILKTMGVEGVLAVEEISRLAHEKIVAGAIGLPLAGGFHDLPKALNPESTLLLDDQQENTHMVVLVDPSQEARKDYKVSEKKPRRLVNVGRHGGIVTLKDGEIMYLGGTLQFLDSDSFEIARATKPYGIGLIRLEIDMYQLGNMDWLILGDEISRRRLEAIYFRRALRALELWSGKRGAKGDGPLTFRLPDFSPEKMPPLMVNALERFCQEQGIKPNEMPMGIDLLTQHPEDLMLPIMKGIVRAVKHKHPTDFRDDSQPPHRKFRVYIELPSIKNGRHLRTYYNFCGQAENENEVDGVFGRKVMLEGKQALDNISDCIWGVDDVGIGSSDVTKDALGIQTRLDPALNAMDPKALLLLNTMVRACNDRGFSPEVCGPMAEDVYSLLLLRGMGVSRVSVNPAVIDHLAIHLAKVTTKQCERLLRGATRRDMDGKPVYSNGEEVFNYVMAEARELFQ